MFYFCIHGWATNSLVWPEELFSSKNSFKYNITPFSNMLDLMKTFDMVWEKQNKKLTLVGWSLGGMLALQLAAQCPNKIEKLVLIGSTPRFTSCENYNGGIPALIVKNLARKLSRKKSETQLDFYQSMFSQKEITVSQKFIQDLAPIFFDIDLDALQNGLSYLQNTDLRHILPSITIPTEIIHGTEDCICLPEAAKYMASTIPYAKVTYLPDAGHVPFLTRGKTIAKIINA